MKYIKGNILDVKSGIIAHGCNRSMGFGSGVAGAIAKKYPIVRKEFMKLNPPPELGSVVPVKVSNDLFIFNCYTQEKYGRKIGIAYVSIDALEKSLRTLACSCANYNTNKINIPQIGSGLGGLSFIDDVNPLLEKIEEEFNNNIEFIVHYL